MSQPITRRRFLVAGASVLAVGAAALVGGTYAQYKISDTETDSAKVANFGAKIEASGYLFEKQYVGSTSNEPSTDANSTGLTVQSSSENKLAPGTQNSTGLSIKLSGSSEVAVKVAFSVKDDISDVHLDGYYPVLYTLTQTKKTDSNGTVLVTNGTLVDVAVALESLSKDSIDPNKDLETEFGTLKITWVWPFDLNAVPSAQRNVSVTASSATHTVVTPTVPSTADERTKYDTDLGKSAAGVALETGHAYTTVSTEAKIDITVTVEQVD